MPPSTPTILSPATGSVVETDTVLAWTTPDDPHPLVVAEIDTAHGASPFVPRVRNLADTRYPWDVTGYQAGATVGVRVRWRDLRNGSVSAWSEVVTITAGRPSSVPTVVLDSLPVLRGATDAEIEAIQSQWCQHKHRLLVRDDDGVWRNLVDLDGEDFTLGVRWSASPDQPVASASLTLIRETETASGEVLSLSPFIEASAANRLADESFAPLVRRGARVQLWTASHLPGVAVTDADYVLQLDGILDDPDWGSQEMTVTARDLGALLQDTTIVQTRTYGIGAGMQWVGDVLREIHADNGHGSLVQYVVGDADWYPTPKEVTEGMTVKEADDAFAFDFGWDARFRPISRTEWGYVLAEPAREVITNDTPSLLTITPSRYLGLPQFRTESDGVRNWIKVWRRDAATGAMSSVLVTDEVSITRHGRRPMQQVFDGGNIDTAAEALAFANLALADLSEPFFRVQIDARYLWPLQPGDVVTLAPDGLHHDQPLKVAVFAVDHELTRDRKRTTLTVRGRPAGAYKRWLDRETTADTTPVGLTATATLLPGAPDDAFAWYRIGATAKRGTIPVTGLPVMVRVREVVGVALEEGAADDEPVPAGTVIRVSRPEQGAVGTFIVRAELPGVFDEIGPIVVPPLGVDLTLPDQIGQLVFTALETIQHPGNATVARVRGVVSDPLGSATGPATITATRTGPDTTVTLVGGGAATVTGPLPLEIIVDAPRHAPDTGDSIVQFWATAPGALPTGERATITPVAPTDTITLAPRLRQMYEEPNACYYQHEHQPLPDGGYPTMTLEVNAPAVLLAGTGAGDDWWKVGRPPYGTAGQSQIRLVATHPGMRTGTATAYITESTTAGLMSVIRVTPADPQPDPTKHRVTARVLEPLTQTDGGPAYTVYPVGTTVTVVDANAGVFDMTKPPAGSPSGQITFRGQFPGRQQQDYPLVIAPQQALPQIEMTYELLEVQPTYADIEVTATDPTDPTFTGSYPVAITGPGTVVGPSQIYGNRRVTTFRVPRGADDDIGLHRYTAHQPNAAATAVLPATREIQITDASNVGPNTPPLIGTPYQDGTDAVVFPVILAPGTTATAYWQYVRQDHAQRSVGGVTYNGTDTRIIGGQEPVLNGEARILRGYGGLGDLVPYSTPTGEYVWEADLQASVFTLNNKGVLIDFQQRWKSFRYSTAI